MVPVVIILLALAQQPPVASTDFANAVPGEGVAVITAACERCDWEIEGREAAVLRVSVDGRYSQHLYLVRGDKPSEYRVSVGRLAAGPHRIEAAVDATLSAKGVGAVTIPSITVSVAPVGDDSSVAQSMAPILYARPNTVGKYTDVPVFMWYEIVPASGGRQFRYSVIFTNEDGGTATDRLMATWGRTTDIEFVYGVELDNSGRVLTEEFQGPAHELPAFLGQHAAGHPLLWVSTDNNMVSESGPTRVRYRPAPER